MIHILEITLKTAICFQYFLETIGIEHLNKIPDGFNNNIFWNIKHTAVTQQALVYG
jgi:hypothetical protein